jgi:hypothetical protein
MKYKVRPGFAVHLTESQIYWGNSEVELTPEQYERHKHQVELVESKPTKTAPTAPPKTEDKK